MTSELILAFGHFTDPSKMKYKFYYKYKYNFQTIEFTMIEITIMDNYRVTC